METSTIVVMVLTNLIMLAGGYYLGVASERERATRVIVRLVDFIGIDNVCKAFGPFGKFKKEKNAKHAGRVRV